MYILLQPTKGDHGPH